MQGGPLKRKLSAHDSLFLYWEHPEQPFHVAEVLVYEGRFSAADLIRMIEARIHKLPRCRQRVVFAPLGLTHPSWADDPEFDVANHVDELELPAPGDDRVLSRVTGQLFAELLDRRRPLWKATVLHGHESGRTVVFLKLHHAMVDGMSSIELVEALHGAAPDKPVPPVPTPQFGPSTSLLHLPWRFAKAGWALARVAPAVLLPAPATPFNRPISAAREIAWVELPRDEFDSVRKQLGATVNDVVLAILSGGLGRYMRRHGFSTDDVVLRAMCPVSVRRPEQQRDLGNLVSMVVAPLHVGVDDAVQRLDTERQAMRRLKRGGQPEAIHSVISLAERLPAPLYAAPWRRGPRIRWPQNIVSTNVPGPRTPLFLDGHELLHWYPFAVQWHDLGFVLCTLSYREHLTLGLVADPTVAPDVWQAADDLRASYEELREAAASHSDGGAGATAAGGLSRECIGAPVAIPEARAHVSVPGSGLEPQS